MRIASKTIRRLLVATGVVAFAGIVGFAQGTPGMSDTAVGLRELSTEVRQLRLAIEESGRTQTQTQALGIYLTVQQSRIMQVAARLESARRELEAAETRVSQLTDEAASVQAAAPTEVNPERRRALDLQYRAIKQVHDSEVLRAQQIRNRESQELQALQVEEARWTDLISKLEQVIKR